MTLKTGTSNGALKLKASSRWLLLLTALSLAFFAILFVYRDGIEYMVTRWERDEYSHGYMIPVVAAFMFWQLIPRLGAIDIKPAWLALLVIVLALAGGVLGELSALYTIIQYSFLLAVYAVAIATFGWRGCLMIWAPLAYLFFMVPLPNFLYNNLSQQLQLISSELGVEVIRLFGISVFLEGNVIDLGSYQLQVVEACSGLRYLFPLMSFGFLIAYLYQGPTWHKWIIFVSTAPITVLMNSFRIGVIGITVKYWGDDMADGFLHVFEGWVVFMACLAMLCLEIWLLNLVSGQGNRFGNLIDLAYPSVSEAKAVITNSDLRLNPVLLGTVLLLLVAAPLSMSLKDRVEIEPQRDAFRQFPLLADGWVGREGSIDAPVLDSLNLTDYIIADYRRGSDEQPVNFYVAYYQSQRKGSSIHSPRSCIPGGGWVIVDHRLESISGIPGLTNMIVNRLVIQKGAYRQLVYYWFDQRGRIITNEYLAKWYLFWDSLTQQRTDGALVRLVTIIPEGADLASADQKLTEFLQTFFPYLSDYVPGKI